MRKIKLLLVTVLLTSVLSIGVNAQQDDIQAKDMRVGNSTLRAMNQSSEDDPLAYISDFLTDSETCISISSSSSSTMTCDKLKLVIYVQEKKDDSWETVKTFTYEKKDTCMIMHIPCYHDINVGSEYRLKTYHYATVNGENYLKINTTGSITAEG